MARLIVTLNNRVLGNQSVAPGQPVTIGRGADNQIVVDNMLVSAHHAKVNFDGQKLIITDLGSRNGTLVNNEKITRAPLSHQDWITVGKHILIVDLHDSLSLSATHAEQLIARAKAASDADQTIVLERDQAEPTWLSFDYLSFLSSRREDFELTDPVVAIGKNPDAHIRLTGLRSWLAGTPAATIEKKGAGYTLKRGNGWLQPKVNGAAVNTSHPLKHQDIITIGPLRCQLRIVRRPSH